MRSSTSDVGTERVQKPGLRVGKRLVMPPADSAAPPLETRTGSGTSQKPPCRSLPSRCRHRADAFPAGGTHAPSHSDHVDMAALVGLDEHSSLNCSRPPNACCGCRRRKATAVSVSRVCRRTLCLSLFCQKRSQGLRLAGCDLHLAMFHSSYRRMMHCTRALCSREAGEFWVSLQTRRDTSRHKTVLHRGM